jgi:hypothetical protein
LGKPMTPHLLRYQGLAVYDYGVTLDASNLPVRRDLRGAPSTFAQLGYKLKPFYHNLPNVHT